MTTEQDLMLYMLQRFKNRRSWLRLKRQTESIPLTMSDCMNMQLLFDKKYYSKEIKYRDVKDIHVLVSFGTLHDCILQLDKVIYNVLRDEPIPVVNTLRQPEQIRLLGWLRASKATDSVTDIHDVFLRYCDRLKALEPSLNKSDNVTRSYLERKLLPFYEICRMLALVLEAIYNE